MVTSWSASSVPSAFDVLNSLDVCIFVLDADYRIKYANEAFLAHTQFDSETILENQLWDVCEVDSEADLKPALDTALKTGRTQTVEFDVKPTETTWEVTARLKNGFLIVSGTDITRHKRSELSLAAEMGASQEIMAKLVVSNAEATQTAHTDLLTGLNNRRKAEDLATSIFRALSVVGSPVSLITFDVDHFKKFNDTYGHAEGDNVLQSVGSAVMNCLSELESAARIGGEEFLLICPQLNIEAAATRAEDFLNAIRGISGTAAPVTASFGVASVENGDYDWKKVLERADKALYKAKANGRNQVATWIDGNSAKPNLRQAS